MLEPRVETVGTATAPRPVRFQIGSGTSKTSNFTNATSIFTYMHRDEAGGLPRELGHHVVGGGLRQGRRRKQHKVRC